ncbi:uncharacterized protein LOC133832094 [Humulus lupulus]|uniref:uncharacterized protein LOC133832094 n=1 Tax=Humulus lupulus TaxID=3486 RepID=UPI002B406430|nr:uncharacterized protein LOC133832094 [Humulus lupulus]
MKKKTSEEDLPSLSTEGKQQMNSLSPVRDGDPLHLVDEEMDMNTATLAEKDNFQASAQSHWVNLRDKLLINEATKLHYEEPIMKNGKKVAQIDLAEVAKQAQNWNSAVICMVLGANPPFAVFEGFVKRIWGHLDIERVVRMHMGLTIVKFNDGATRDFVLENGIAQFDKKPVLGKYPVIVRPWTQDLDTIRLVRSVPLWIRLPNLGLQYWGKKCLSSLVSTIGKPIMVDKFIKDRYVIRFARVLVEMEITNDPPFIIHFVNERGQIQEQFAEYEWLPIKCKNCKGFGHNVADYAKANIGETFGVNVATKVVEAKQNESGIDIREAAETQGSSQVHLISRTQANKENWEVPKKVGNSKSRGKTVSTNLDSKQNVFKVLQEHEAREKNGWNVRGMNKRDKQHAILSLLKMNKVGICALLENKLKKDKANDMMNKVFFGWDHYSSTVTEGILLVLWRKSFVKVQVLLEHQQFIHCLVRFSSLQLEIVITFVYGFNSLVERLGGKMISANEILDSTAWLACSQLASLKLDRHLAELNSIAELQWEVHSDHCFFLIRTLKNGNLGIKPFRFFNCWIAHSRFKEIVMDSWHKPMTAGGLLGVTKKLLRLKHVLKVFNRKKIEDIEQGYHLAKGVYQLALSKAQDSPSDATAQKAEKRAAIGYKEHYARYRSYLIQRSKVTWLQKGDENNSYFHACIKKRREENRIVSFMNDQGDIIADYNVVVHHFLDHFRSYMGSHSSTTSLDNTDCIELGPCLDIDMQLGLIRKFTKVDVKKALFSIPGIKSPGLDGYNSEFYKAMWKQIGDDISAAVLDFFSSGKILAELNKTVLALVPKIEIPSRAIDYRPIACCNTLYKCISKMLCSRLSEVLPTLINPNQGAFIRGRSLAHNILIFQDLIKNYNRRNTSPRCAMKIALSKAYDTVDWGFFGEVINLLVISYQVFDDFCNSTGMKANLSKSQVFFGGISAQDKVQLQQLLQLAEGTFPLKYLGIPMRPTK